MGAFGLNRLLDFLTSIELLMAVLWLGLAIFTLALAILLYTRWGQYKPLRKCMGLSLFAHLLMAGYATTVEIVTPAAPPPEPVIHLSIGDVPDDSAAPAGAIPMATESSDRPWEVFPTNAVAQPKQPELQRDAADRSEQPERVVRATTVSLTGRPAVDHVALPAVKPIESQTVKRSTADESAAAIDAPAAQRRDAPEPTITGTEGPDRLTADASEPPRQSANDLPTALLEPIVPLPKMSDADLPEPFVARGGFADSARRRSFDRTIDNDGNDTATASGESDRFSSPSIAGLTGKASTGEGGGQGGLGPLASNVSLPSSARLHGQPPVPDAYRLRVAPDRTSIAKSHGGTVETEAAVKAGLKWLADNQSADGRWDPRVHGAGIDAKVQGRDRQNAGSHSDTAMTGLALLAFLGSGHTHLDGPYRDDVRRGLEFLAQSQAADGNLGGEAVAFEFMYCHAIATCALSEAYGMTRDRRLYEPVQRAINYTVAAQDPKGGGWRYKPGDAGDTSQLGWQLMSLKSAELAGIPMSETTRQGAIRFLQSVGSGQYGGLASYRPGEMTSRSMTAEALVCWQFLGIDREHPACNEAADYVVGELPGDGIYNLYYWYYATLGTYQLQDVHWRQWNDALRDALVSRQVKEGPLAGSWDTGALWAGHGGRVYTTALASLTLEVYYRFLPIYGGVAAKENRVR